MNNKIIVDTSIWIEYFRNNKSYVNLIEENLDLENIYILGPIVSELLHGVKDEKEYDLLSRSMDSIPFLDCTYDDWANAGNILFKVKKSGISIPLTDAIIGAVALRYNASVLTLDSYFKKIKSLRVLGIN